MYNFRIDVKYISHDLCAHHLNFAACPKCKGKGHRHGRTNEKTWMNDSGCSEHTTFDLNDFIEFHELEQKITVRTATAVAFITGVGTVLVHFKDADDDEIQVARLAPVFYMKECTARLIVQGRFPQDGKTVQGDAHSVMFWDKDELFLSFEPRLLFDTIYILHDYSLQPLVRNAIAYSVDHTTMHRRLGHPSREVLRQLRKHTEGSPPFVVPDKEDLCEGCAKGKMHLRPFPSTGRRAEKPFETIHSDLKEFPVTSYHKYKYTIVLFDNCTSYGWNTHLKTKDAAFNAIKQFIAMVERQFPSYKILNWMSDGGGEYRSGKLDEFFKDKGTVVFRPYVRHASRTVRRRTYLTQ